MASLSVWSLLFVSITVTTFPGPVLTGSTLPDCRPRSPDHDQTVFRIAVTLPAMSGPKNGSWLFAREKVSPAIDIAIDTVRNRSLLAAGIRLVADYADDEDDIGQAMDMAITFYLKGQADVFFGPLTDYNIAPIARQTRYWNVPLVTPGAMSNDFMDRRERLYPMLTRVGTNFGHLADYVLKILDEFKFKKVKLIYEPMGNPPFSYL